MHKQALGAVGVFLLFSAAAFAQNTVTAIVPTTTLAAETGNNTSAAAGVSALTAGHNPSGNMSKVPLKSLLYSNSKTKVYAAIMGWFGKSSHISVGYNSQSSIQVRNQVEDMQSRGIDGAILAWYGANSYEDATAKALKQQAELHPGFEFAIMVDKGTLDWNSMGMAPTDALIYHLNYIAQNYYSSPAYMRINDRPVVFEFALEFYTIDWARVRASVKGNPIVIFRNPNGWARPLSDGAYAWGPSSDLSYLDFFYGQAAKYHSQITMGGGSPGFDDSLASWTQNRFVDRQCGQTWLNTLNDANKHYSALSPLQYMQIATWNDYEEGTAIESGIDNCLAISASLANQSVTWTLSGLGKENTLDHYTVFISSDGQKLMPLGDAPTGTTSFDLSSYSFAPGSYSVYVKAVAKPSLANHMSNPATLVVANKAPTAELSLDTTNGLAPVTVSASTAGSTDSDGSIAATSIDFGDGTVASAAAASHTYKVPGRYTISAKVTDNYGATAVATSDVIVGAPYVTITRPARSVRDAAGNLQVTSSASPVRVEATATSGASIDVMNVLVDNAGVYSVRAPGLAADLPIPPGMHSIVVTATDTNGQSARSDTMVQVPDLPPTARLSITPSAGAGLVAYTASTAGSTDSDGSIAASSIDFGDGTVANSPTASHTYAHAGTYTVTATVTDDMGTTASTSSTVIVANLPPLASLSVATSGAGPVSYNFSTTGSSDLDGRIVSTTIAFGDGASAPGPAASHVYAKAGTYVVTATVTDDFGASANSSATVAVANLLPLARIAVTKSGAQSAFTVTTAGSADLDGRIVSTRIDFGDGSFANAASATHTYAKPGSYTVTATVTDDLGGTASASSLVNVVNFPPVAAISASAGSTVAPGGITFSAANSSDKDGRIVSTRLDFGDGASATGASATHQYLNPGTYTVTATVTDDMGATSSAKTTVQVQAPAVVITSPVQGATVGSATKVTALVRSSLPIASMIVYVDDVRSYTVFDDALSATLALKPGTHTILIKSWTTTGIIYRNSVTVTVK